MTNFQPSSLVSSSSYQHLTNKVPIKGVLFDLDGTLADTAPDLVHALNLSLKDFGYPQQSIDSMRSAASHGSLALVNAAQPDLSIDETTIIQQRLLTYYHQINGDNTEIFDGLQAVLSLLDNKGIPYGVVTNKAARFARPLLDVLDLTQRMCTIISGDSTLYAKPHTAPMWLAAQQMNCASHTILYLGDAERDLIAAKNANMIGGVALWGYINHDDLPNTWPADHYFAAGTCLEKWLIEQL
ncbi:HAD family hydrolase [Shewanella surugensis]|uniref:HAD-IA family hydrolase n=1 Tax=Shewanella surugensis TaxID=212020 RepID=A0ABT0LDF2_9GAMM|nr:HAD-IA family hydrolase [Shewanella surugensis]MCL1125722.1 HAD-IA family hydrolase [Shewanella surugensis]